MRYSADELKRKLRELKKQEVRIRFKGQPVTGAPKLVWDVFFSTNTKSHNPVKYSFSHLLGLNREEFKAVMEEYFYRIYFQHFQENGLREADVYDPQLLSLLGLPAYAGMAEIKGRFRELAKRYHPDHGGDSEKFIELMDIYERLKEDPTSS